MTTARVGLVVPYLTAYRLPFFARLRGELDARNIELAVAHGLPTGLSAARRDTVELPGSVALRQRAWKIAGRDLIWLGLGELARTSDALVLPQSMHHLHTYPLLARRRPRIGLWGHGRTHVSAHGSVARRAKAALTRRADWFFAYTEAGGAYAVQAGLPRQRVTVVHNSLDTTALAAARDAVTDADVAVLHERYGLTAGRTALYIGGLDELKRTPFLIAAAERVARQLPGFRLVVAGDGAHRPLVQAAQASGGPLVYLGTVGDRDKALLGAASDVLLVPGAVGLCAVDSFALRTPVITCPWPYHGPEFEYLESGRNALVAPGDPEAFAAAVAGLLTEPGELSRLRRACQADATRYTVEGMAARFARGVEGLLHGTTRGGN
ncbi:glycosyltransferase family 4 protein [Streptomyces sp. P9(2023)]|uniref:glycosyltransferase family 4 protein n=1 Tax=Streptomyces sp. P9(2023) TaxID=3064394 RepID=UPI0028F43AA3|nr:glycosyltransferase family 4 protein [Streptomyces sp. P9(2023)]MDT9691293.1 glycosyltransferase family 4 protein [Streptomyces sp. P9(2023)]